RGRRCRRSRIQGDRGASAQRRRIQEGSSARPKAWERKPTAEAVFPVPPTVLARANEVIESIAARRRGGRVAACRGCAAASDDAADRRDEATLPRIEVLRVKPIDPAVRRLRFQLSDGSVDLMKAFSLGGSEGVGGVWKIPPHIALPETFDTRYGQW